MPDIGHRDREKLRERALTIDSYSLGVGAKMTPARETIAAMAADNVTFAGDEITWRKTFHARAHTLDHADKLMPHDHRHRDGLLRPCVPVINVDIGSADRRFPDPDEHVIVADLPGTGTSSSQRPGSALRLTNAFIVFCTSRNRQIRR